MNIDDIFLGFLLLNSVEEAQIYISEFHSQVDLTTLNPLRKNYVKIQFEVGGSRGKNLKVAIF